MHHIDNHISNKIHLICKCNIFDHNHEKFKWCSQNICIYPDVKGREGNYERKSYFRIFQLRIYLIHTHMHTFSAFNVLIHIYIYILVHVYLKDCQKDSATNVYSIYRQTDVSAIDSQNEIMRNVVHLLNVTHNS